SRVNGKVALWVSMGVGVRFRRGLHCPACGWARQLRIIRVSKRQDPGVAVPTLVPSFPMPAAVGQQVPVRPSLPEVFARIPDPRGRRGRVHGLPVVMSLVSCAVAAGSRSQAAILEWIADAPQELLE